VRERCEWSDLPTETCAHCTGARALPMEPELRHPETVRGVRVWPPAEREHEIADWIDGPKAPKASTRCRYVEDWGFHLPEHEPTCRARECNGCKPCTHDDNGNPIKHCGARKSCTEHLDDAHPLTCPRCIARVRNDLDEITRLSALMLPEAVEGGIESTAAVLAGPATNPAQVSEIRAFVRGHVQHRMMGGTMTDDQAMKVLAALPDDDDHHPYTLLGRWELMLAEDYGHERKGRITIASAASYLSWLLTDMAQDERQDFALFASEIATCRSHLEAVLGASRKPERGAPCWKCGTPAPRLTRRRAHWCTNEDCTREHDTTGARDTWVCPDNPDHWWPEADYRRATAADAQANGYTPKRGQRC